MHFILRKLILKKRIWEKPTLSMCADNKLYAAARGHLSKKEIKKSPPPTHLFFFRGEEGGAGLGGWGGGGGMLTSERPGL